jgi:hypothetical protein
MGRERDYLAEACLLYMQERETRGRGAAGDDECRRLEEKTEQRHVDALQEFAKICQLRVNMRARQRSAPSTQKGILQ